VPREFNPTEILETLARHRVRFVVIGNFAGLLAGADVSTQDVDITPATDPDNLDRLAAALAELDAGIRVDGEAPVPLPPPDGRLLATAEIWNLSTRYGDLDITTMPSGTSGYDDLRRGARSSTLGGGLRISVASLEDVIRSKTAAGRAKDQLALPVLQRALERERNDLDLDL